jgi:hypothetical protein
VNFEYSAAFQGVKMDRTKLKAEFEALDALPRSLSGEEARRRGRLFESLVLDLFESQGMLVRRSYHTADGKSEQIDGAIRVDGRIALVESKWVSSKLAASDLFAFSGKVDGKFTGTIGVFISRNELSENFSTALRTGRRQSILVIHGKDIPEIFEETFSLHNYLKSYLQISSIDNVSYYSVQQFKNSQVSPVSYSEIKVIPEIVNDELKMNDFENIVDEIANKIEDKDVENILITLLDKYSELAKQGKLDSQYSFNLTLLAKELKPRLSNRRLELDWSFFNRLSRDFLTSPLRTFAAIFPDRLRFLTPEEVETVSQRLVKQWHKIVGNYDRENEMANITEPLWKYIDKGSKVELLSIFVSFVVSSRVPRYPQVRLAEECIREANKREIEDAVSSLLKKNVESWMEDIDHDGFTEEDRRRLIKWQTREYGTLSPKVPEILENLIDENLVLRKNGKIQ